MKLIFLKNNKSKKALSPIISVVLLILLAAILTGAILSWSKNSVKEKLDTSSESIRRASDLDCINSNFHVESCEIDFFTKDVSLLLINDSSLDYGNLILTVNGLSFEGADEKIFGTFKESINAGESKFLSTSSNFSFKDGNSFDSLDPYNIKNISLVSLTCPNNPIILTSCDVIVD